MSQRKLEQISVQKKNGNLKANWFYYGIFIDRHLFLSAYI